MKNNKDSSQYIWRTVQDDKVRGSHAAREGKTFLWTNPPEGGHPGEDYNCRCWAETVNAEATGLKQEIISSINDGRKWTTFDFGYHFAFGNGRAVTLDEIGHLSGVIEISQQKIFPKIESQVTDKMRQIQSGSLIYRTENGYQFSGAHWVLGKGVVQTQTVGRVKKNGNILTLNAEVTYTYSDEITDPVNIREAIRGHHRIHELPNAWWGGAELFVTDLFLGRAYAVNGVWKTKLSGSISLK